VFLLIYVFLVRVEVMEQIVNRLFVLESFPMILPCVLDVELVLPLTRVLHVLEIMEDLNASFQFVMVSWQIVQKYVPGVELVSHQIFVSLVPKTLMVQIVNLQSVLAFVPMTQMYVPNMELAVRPTIALVYMVELGPHVNTICIHGFPELVVSGQTY
jgi:hypothetical protein